jgi:hypothetical protein
MHHELAFAAPPGVVDYLIVAISVVVLVVALWLFIRAFGHSREDEANHIKRRILSDQDPRPGDER